MDVTPSSLEKFAAWLRDSGRSDATLDLYKSCLRSCSSSSGGLTSRLIDRELAPKTRRANKAALASWASFTGDAGLARRLTQIRLPPATRVKPKVELQLEDWKALVRHLRGAKLREPMRAVLMIMAMRGLRSGDVLRMRRREVADALRTGVLAFEAKGGRRLEYDAAPIREQLEALERFEGWDRVRELISASAGPRAVSNRVRRELAAQAAEIKLVGVHPHRLRRTYATYFLRRLDRDPQGLIKLQKHMNWASMATAAGYVDATSADELNAIGSKLTSDLFG